MRRIYQLSVLCLAAGVLSACYPDQVVNTENIPTAGIRFINAVPDSSGAFGFDMRFVDIVESNTQFYMTFRDGPTQSVTSGNVGYADHRVQDSAQGRAGRLAPLPDLPERHASVDRVDGRRRLDGHAGRRPQLHVHPVGQRPLGQGRR